MNLVQTGYNILLVLTICDGEYDEKEGRVILDFLEDNYDGTFDAAAENKAVMGLDDAGIRARFETAAAAFMQGALAADREAVLEFGLDLIMTDGELSEEENAYVQQLSELWEIPLQPLVARIV